MKALLLHGGNKTEFREVPVPVIEENEALIRVICRGICGTDKHIYHGDHASAKFPVIPCHEFVGELVEAKGKDAGRFQIGDIVAAQEMYPCGHCAACIKGEDNVCESLKVIGVHVDGSCAEYVKVPVSKMVKVPKELDIEMAAMIEPWAVAVHDVNNSGLKYGDKVLVMGGGTIGLLIAIASRAAGASKVVVCDTNAFKREFAQNMGFDTADPNSDSFFNQLMEFTDHVAFDISFDVVAATSTFDACLKNTKTTGKIVLVGITTKPCEINVNAVVNKEITIIGVRIHNFKNYLAAVEILRDEKIRDQVGKLISKVFPFEQSDEAFKYAALEQNAYKVLIKND